MKNFFDYIQSAFDELVHKVSWPTWETLQKYTILVSGATIVATLLVVVMDKLFTAIMSFIY